MHMNYSQLIGFLKQKPESAESGSGLVSQIESFDIEYEDTGREIVNKPGGSSDQGFCED